MHFFAEFALLSVSLACVQGQLVIPKINDLNTVFSLYQFERFLNVDQLQDLRNEIFTTIITDLANHEDITTLAQAVEQLVTQYIPQANQMHIDWIAFCQSALSDLLSGAPGSLIHKRDLDANELQLFSQLSMDKLAQIVEVATIPDRATALANLQQLLQNFFPVYQSRTDFDDLATDLLNHLNGMLPDFNQHAGPIAG